MFIPLFSVLGRQSLGLGNTAHSLLNDLHSAHEKCQYSNARLQSLSYRGFVKPTPRTLVWAINTVSFLSKSNPKRPAISLNSALATTGKILWSTLPRKACVCLSTSSLSGGFASPLEVGDLACV